MAKLTQSLLRVSLALGAIASLAACDPAERVEAPAGVRDLARWFFANHRTASAEEVDAALTNLIPSLEAETADGNPKFGSLDALTEDDIAFTGLDVDPSPAAGFFLMNRLDCDIDTLEEIVTAENQNELYDGVYDSYTRSYSGSRDDYLDGATDSLPWTIDYSATPIAETYTANADAGMWRIEGGESGAGKVLMQSAFLTAPADFGGAENHAYEQDYQVELYFSVDGESVLHFYPLWRYMQIGAFSVEDDFFVELLLNGLIDWDENTEALCQTWPDLPEG